MVNKTVIILGAGMSGLVTAYEFAQRGIKVRVIEKLGIPGGLARTERYADYYIDAGPHLFYTSNPEIVSYWQRIFPDVFRTPALYGMNFVDGNYFEYPLSESSLEKLPSDMAKRIKIEIQMKDPERMRAAKNYREYMEALAGPTLQSIFYEEYPEKLWGIPTSELSANWAPQRIEIRKEKKPFHADQWSGVAREGCGRTMEILAEKIHELGGTVEYNCEVTGLDQASNLITCVRTTGGNIRLADEDLVVSTLPITVNSDS